MRTKLPFQWEKISENEAKEAGYTVTMRAKVIGGWLVKDGTEIVGRSITESMVFVADQHHEWQIELKENQS